MIKVKKICIEVNGKTINLSLKEAQELKDILVDMFGPDEVVVYRDRYFEPYWRPYVSYSSNNIDTSWEGGVTSNTLYLKSA